MTLTVLDVANGKAVCRMSQVFPPSHSQSPSRFHVGKILIYAMPNTDYHKIDLNAPYTMNKKYHFFSQKEII